MPSIQTQKDGKTHPETKKEENDHNRLTETGYKYLDTRNRRESVNIMSD